MVLWEITLGTAYFLGLKRTYRLGLRIQRRLISPKHPRIRQFLRRRTRVVFDLALKVHHKVQQRDIEVGRNLGNWILRWLDRMKPSAQIRGPPPKKQSNGASTNLSMTKQVLKSSQLKSLGNTQTSRNQESDRRLFTAYKNVWPKPFASVSVMRMPKPIGASVTQYRHLCVNGVGALGSNYTKTRFEGVIRKDILQWMQQ